MSRCGVALAATTWNLEPLQLVPTLIVAALYLRGHATLARARAAGAALAAVPLLARDRARRDRAQLAGRRARREGLLLRPHGPARAARRPRAAVLRRRADGARPAARARARRVDRLRFLTHPLVALPIWAVDLYLWHIPVLYQAALHHNAVHALEHFLFFTCGCLMWSPVLETLPAPEWFGTGWKLGYIVAVRFLETILGNVFIWSSSMFYPCTSTRTRRGGSRRPRPEPGRGGDDGRGRARHARALAWLFLRLAAEGELKQRLLEQGYDPRQVARAVRYGRAKDLGAAP